MTWYFKPPFQSVISFAEHAYFSPFWFMTYLFSVCILFNFIFVSSQQNDVSDVPDLTFSMDADEEKHILYEKNEVNEHFILAYRVLPAY